MGDTLTLDEGRNQYVDDHGTYYARVTTILDVEGLRLPYWAAPDALDRARWRGNEVHLATEYLDAGTLDWETLAEELHPFVWAWERFKQEHESEITDCETIVVSKRMRIAGRYDRLGWRRGPRGRRLRSLVDLKTGPPNGVQFQLAAYLRAHQEQHPDDEPLIERLGVQLLATGEYKLHGPYTDPRDLTIMQYRRVLYHEKRNRGLLPEQLPQLMVPTHA